MRERSNETPKYIDPDAERRMKDEGLASGQVYPVDTVRPIDPTLPDPKTGLSEMDIDTVVREANDQEPQREVEPDESFMDNRG